MSNGTIVVVGLGPAGAEYLTVATQSLLNGTAPVWLRTSRHPAAEGLDVAGSFDHLYESLDSFDEVYTSIVANLVDFAVDAGLIVYAVPGSPTVAEHTVELLRAHEAVRDGEIELVIHPAMGFTELCWNALGIDPMAEAVTIVDALSIEAHGAGRRGPFLVTQVHSTDVLDDLIMAIDDAQPGPVTVLQRLGTEDEFVAEVPWNSLRSSVKPDHLTSLWVPTLNEPLGASVTRLDELIRSARESSNESIDVALRSIRDALPPAAHAAHEATDRVLDAIDDAQFDLEDALVHLLDLLMQHSQLASEAGFFTIHDIADGVGRRYL